jgi:uncharacterized pyridoxamine 5'-phosphate oxidase family protein
MEKIVSFIKEVGGVGFFATTDGRQARVRPFGFGFYEDGKLWFCTNNQKKVFAQLKAEPYAEVLFTKPDYSRYVRVSGHVVFDESPEAKAKVMAAMPGVKALYQRPDNPIFEVFYLEKGQAVLESFPPKGPAEVVPF